MTSCIRSLRNSCKPLRIWEEILNNPERCKEVMEKEELQEVKEKYGDDRRTEIIPDEHEFNAEDFYPNDPVIITISHLGYIKRTPLADFKEQARGGVGSKGARTREETSPNISIQQQCIKRCCSLLVRGSSCYWMKCYDIPEGDKNSKGRAIQNMLSLEPGDSVNAFLRIQGLG